MSHRSPLPFIGVRMHRNRTLAGRRTSTPARRAAHYYAYGRDLATGSEKEQRGLWYGPDGKVRDHEQVLAWARQQALDSRYTFEAILSVQRGTPAAEDFCRAMQQGETIHDWRLLVHHDTDYRHAHVLFFHDKRMEKVQFLAWQQQVREALLQLERQQMAQQQLQIETGAGKALGMEIENR